MAATLDVSCPKCGKQLKVPAELEGKRVRCKECQEIFPVVDRKKGSGKPAAAKPAAKAAAKPAPKAPPAPPAPEPAKSRFADEDDEDEDMTPGKAPRAMGVLHEEDVARCPHCAKELDPPDAVVCKNCGFNNLTRVKFETKKVVASDTTDWITHLGPGILAAVIAIALIVVDIVCAVNMRGWMEGGDLESDEVDLTGRKKMFVHPGAFIAMIVAASIFIVVPALRFAFRRLVLNAKPVEKVKK
jgi:hypothetical protein